MWTSKAISLRVVLCNAQRFWSAVLLYRFGLDGCACHLETLEKALKTVVRQRREGDLIWPPE